MAAELAYDPNTNIRDIGDDYKYGFKDKEDYIFKSGRGLTTEIVEAISKMKNEPQWMLDFRLKALETFRKKPMPTWGNTKMLEDIDFENIYYYIKPSEKSEKNWEDVPEGIKNTFDRLGIPEAERKFLAGVTAQYESEVVYHSIREDLVKQGVIFLDMDSGLREHEEIVRKHFATVIPAADNKFSALNSAVWSGGSFIWVPEGVKVEIPLQAYFRINAENMGQFERTLIIAEPGSFVHYIEGCTAPIYTTDSLHSAVVELIAKPGAHIRYTTIQNWSRNVYNLVTKRAVAEANAKVEWVDGNLGSKLTMKYPAIYLTGEGATGEVLSVAFSGHDQHQDAGAKIVHAAPNTTSIVTSKSISKDGGRTSYRGLVKVLPGATGVKTSVKCDALLLDEHSRSDTYPTMEIDEKDVSVEHEATVSKVGEEQLFYLMSRGLTADEAKAMVVNGFFEPFTKELPLEYAVELNRLIQLEMEGSVG
jgi:Fe-S cluster assembly protein SufB